MKEIVIKLSDRIYEHIMEYSGSPRDKCIAIDAIKHGTVLPAHHGRLVDIDKFEKFWEQECPADCGCCAPKRRTDGRGKWYDVCILFDKAPTILEATE